VRVAARRDGDTLAIEVSDDGPGFHTPPAPAAPGVDAPSPAGIGLAHTRERLALLYGARASLATGDGAEGGGVVRIVLPWRVADGAP
jgi:sensor histidine kinase YesM